MSLTGTKVVHASTAAALVTLVTAQIAASNSPIIGSFQVVTNGDRSPDVVFSIGINVGDTSVSDFSIVSGSDNTPTDATAFGVATAAKITAGKRALSGPVVVKVEAGNAYPFPRAVYQAFGAVASGTGYTTAAAGATNALTPVGQDQIFVLTGTTVTSGAINPAAGLYAGQRFHLFTVPDFTAASFNSNVATAGLPTALAAADSLSFVWSTTDSKWHRYK